ncbi:hypothetical protein DPEC_G00328780 [Dallia pectoralis]|uniref:Uncharacterized protein n=1 Tax=Dallia pectoralis TaxID=75939 RepID=A0ACC2F8U0_DALPE|nr:hypothetical protein DPEC_G00328780 [Dallia pectoralis]
MEDLHNSRCLYIFTVLLTIESMLTNVQGSELENDDKPDATYALIGAGIGLFFAICFIGSKLYIIKKQMFNNEYSENPVKRTANCSALVDMKDRTEV